MRNLCHNNHSRSVIVHNHNDGHEHDFFKLTELAIDPLNKKEPRIKLDIPI